MPGAVGLAWELLARDQASPAFLRVAGAADKAAASTARATKSVGGTAAAMGRAGAKLTKGLTLPLVGLGAVAVDQAAKFQKGLNTVQVATDRTNRQMAASSKGLLTVAKSTGTTLGSLTDAFYVASKSGLSVAKSLDITKAAAQGAKAEGADLGTVTDSLTSVMASYGKTLRSPVAAMNEIIKGSGLAKTTVQDFAGSLSNVVPIASALHISFAQVAGAIATMTQHGETAQRATDNLSNLITNLAGQNNVAASALGQLGVHTIDLSRNLGKRGLTGSLNLVLNAIDKNKKGGLIVTKAFKQSATATASLRQEINAMPPALQANAKAFDKGTMSYKDFYAYAKSLGGQQYQLAKGFISTEGTAKGFSQQLKSGNSTTSTLARTLQKALGGVTGMRTALMLSGNSAKTFAADTKAVAKAALNAGSDVLGWNKTQDLLSTKMDKAKASLQVLAVEIGTKLIPVVTKIVDGVTSAVHWFDSLSGTQRTVLAWSVGILAALGPVLSIGGRLALVGKGLMATSTMFATAGSRVALSMQRMTAAIGGAAVGVAVGELTKNSSKAVKAVGVLGAAAAGAALGSAGGPWGALIGGLAGGVGALATQWLGASDDAKQSGKVASRALQEQKQAADDLLGSLQAVDGAYNKQYRTQVGQELQKKGGLDLAASLHVSGRDVLGATLGNSKAYQRVQESLTKYYQGAGSKDLLFAASQGAKLTKIIESMSGAANHAENEYTLLARATGKGIVPTKQLAAGTKSLGKELKGTGTSLNQSTFFGARNTEVIRENIAYLHRQENQQIKSGKSVAVASKNYDDQTGALRRSLVQMGFNGKGLDRLFEKFMKLPSTITPTLKTGPAVTLADKLQARIKAIKQGKVPGVDVSTGVGISKLLDLQARLDRLRNKSIQVDVNTVFRSSTGGHTLAGSAGGRAQVPEGVSAVGERGTELLVKNGSRLGVVPHGPAMSWLRATGSRIQGFASGTSPSPITTSTSDGHKVWIFDGIRYASLAAAQNARTRAQKADPNVVSTAIGKIGGAPSSPIDLSGVGVARVWAQIRAAQATLAAQVAKGLSGKAAGQFRSQIHHVVHVANRELNQLQVKIRTSDVHAVRKALKGSASDTRAAFTQLFSDLRHANAPGGVLSALQKAETGLIANQKAIATQNARLDRMMTYRASIRSTLSGAFDPTTFGSVQDLTAGLRGATGTNNTYAHELTQLRHETRKGSALRKFINQLAASGQTTTLATLAGASRSELRNVAKNVGAYDQSLAAGANAATTAKFNESVKQQHADVDRLVKAQHDALSSMHELAVAVAHIASTGPTKAQDKRLERIIGQLEGHVKAARRSGSGS